jgi:6-pyruvoyltetrahydropterin/6-carboxytetrahydropterin synthase
VVEVAFQTPTLNRAGIAFDFVDLKRHLRELAEGLDHRNLNDLPQFRDVETSAENQARYFYESLRSVLPPELAGGLLYARVWETPTQWAQYGMPDGPIPAPRSPDQSGT